MKLIKVGWSPYHAEGGCMIKGWDMLIIIGEEKLYLTEAEAGALLNELRIKIDIPLTSRRIDDV